MNNRTTDIFDAWIINQHNRLKERIASSTIFDDDAFQETYLTMREALRVKDIELEFEPVFIKLYRRMLARELSTEFRYSHPDPGKSSVSCPLKPSDSAPLKHSTMPP